MRLLSFLAAAALLSAPAVAQQPAPAAAPEITVTLTPQDLQILGAALQATPVLQLVDKLNRAIGAAQAAAQAPAAAKPPEGSGKR